MSVARGRLVMMENSCGVTRALSMEAEGDTEECMTSGRR